MNFRFKWYNPQQTVMLYLAEGDWSWRDWHACNRAAAFSMLHREPGSVHALVDLRGSTRQAMPSGMKAHLRTVGQKLSPALSGRALLLGMPPEAEATLETDSERRFETIDGFLQFVDDEASAQHILAQWETET